MGYDGALYGTDLADADKWALSDEERWSLVEYLKTL